jgi:enamine deaminase RidA (YjgF/YER057c/UK114 family)
MRSKKDRRSFLRDGLLVAAGASAASLLSLRASRNEQTANSNRLFAAQVAGGPEQRLRELSITLPPPPTPVAVYIPAVVDGKTLYTSGHGPRHPDGTYSSGKVGADLTLEQGYAAARLVGLNVLSSIKDRLGSLDRIERLVKVLGMVNCTADFAQQPQVINGFSELMVAVFGEEAGKGARSAVGMNALPSNIPVEIEAIFKIR